MIKDYSILKEEKSSYDNSIYSLVWDIKDLTYYFLKDEEPIYVEEGILLYTKESDNAETNFNELLKYGLDAFKKNTQCAYTATWLKKFVNIDSYDEIRQELIDNYELSYDKHKDDDSWLKFFQYGTIVKNRLAKWINNTYGAELSSIYHLVTETPLNEIIIPFYICAFQERYREWDREDILELSLTISQALNLDFVETKNIIVGFINIYYFQNNRRFALDHNNRIDLNYKYEYSLMDNEILKLKEEFKTSKDPYRIYNLIMNCLLKLNIINDPIDHSTPENNNSFKRFYKCWYEPWDPVLYPYNLREMIIAGFMMSLYIKEFKGEEIYEMACCTSRLLELIYYGADDETKLICDYLPNKFNDKTKKEIAERLLEALEIITGLIIEPLSDEFEELFKYNILTLKIFYKIGINLEYEYLYKPYLMK